MRKRIEVIRQKVDQSLEKTFSCQGRIQAQNEHQQQESIDKLSRLVRHLEEVSKS